MQFNPNKNVNHPLAQDPLRRWSPCQRRLTQAHLALAQRPSLATASAGALKEIAASLNQELGTDLFLEAHLLDGEVRAPAALASNALFIWIELTSAGGYGLLEVHLSAVVQLLELMMGKSGPGIATELTRIEEAALGFLCLKVLAALNGVPEIQIAAGPRLCGFVSNRAEASKLLNTHSTYVSWQIHLTREKPLGSFRLLLPSREIAWGLAKLPIEPVMKMSSEMQRARLPCAVRLGKCEIMQRDLAALSAKDVVLFAGLKLSDNGVTGRGRLWGPTFFWEGELRGEGFYPTQAVQAFSKEAFMADKTVASGSSSHLLIQLHIELGPALVELAQLGAVKPGALIPLRLHPNDPVTLKVGDRPVARAELVEIEGQVGARILSLLESAP